MTFRTKRKYVEQEIAEDYSFPSPTQSILKIVKPRGNNLHQVVTSTGEEFLASMPPKFRKHIWIKRGDFVVTEPIHEGRKVKAEIVKILTKDHIKYYIKENVWPEGFKERENITKNYYNVNDCDNDIMPNPNRVPCSESDDSSDDIMPNANRGPCSESDDSSDDIMPNPNKVPYSESDDSCDDIMPNPNKVLYLESDDSSDSE